MTQPNTLDNLLLLLHDKAGHCEKIAQNKLVNLTIRLAVDALYDHCAQEHWAVLTTPDGWDKSLGETKEDVLKNLTRIDNEFDRVKTFDKLAKANDFPLRLKTAGAKSKESTKRKQCTSAYANGRPLPDQVRITAMSSDLSLLNRLADILQKTISSQLAQPNTQLSTEIEDWEMNTTGMLRKVLKNNVDGLGAEVQILPYEQAKMPARITHHFFSITRVYDQLTKAHPNIELNAPFFTPMPLKDVAPLIENYNEVAQFMNQCASNEPMSNEDRLAINDVLKSLDASPQTLDESSEVDGEKSGKTKNYSPIFKTMADIKSYRSYMRKHGEAMNLFPLPELSTDSTHAEVATAMMKLTRCSQLTHSCYIHKAPEAMRNLWVQKAHDNNRNLSDALKLPESVLADVNQTLDLATLAQGEARGR